MKVLFWFVSFCVIFYTFPILYFKKSWFKLWFHDTLKWHIPESCRWNDGCSNHSVCKYCKKDIMQDSQGNWF